MARDPNRETYDFDNDPSDVPQGISERSMRQFPMAIAVADARMKDLPLVYVNEAFEAITGYPAASVVGRNCRFLQGEATDEADRRAVREAIAAKEEVTTDIVNYRADGSRFVNRLMVTPLSDDDGRVTHFLGVQSERPDDVGMEARARKLDESLREIQHRVKNHLAMLLALIRLEARQNDGAQGSLDVLANRVEALNLLYDGLARDGRMEAGTVGLGAYVSRVASALNMLDGQRDVIVNVDTEPFEADLNAASQVGLLLSELLTNALQHAFDGDAKGQVSVRLSEAADGRAIRLEVDDNGSGLPEGIGLAAHGQSGCADRARPVDAAGSRSFGRQRRRRHPGDAHAAALGSRTAGLMRFPD